MPSKTVAHYSLHDDGPDVPMGILFVFKFTRNEAGAPKLVSAKEFVGSLAAGRIPGRNIFWERVQDREQLVLRRVYMYSPSMVHGPSGVFTRSDAHLAMRGSPCISPRFDGTSPNRFH